MERKILVFYLIISLCFVGLLQSCATKRNLVYFSNLPDSTSYNEIITNNIEPKIQKGDALGIKVTTLNPDANILFNSGSLPMSNQTTGVSSSVSAAATLPEGYIVDEKGEIDFPQLGKIYLEGLTKEQAQMKIASEVSKTAKDPIVNIRILNFKISVLEKLHILEASIYRIIRSIFLRR